MEQKELVIDWIIENYGTDSDGANEMLNDFFQELDNPTILVEPDGDVHILYKCPQESKLVKL